MRYFGIMARIGGSLVHVDGPVAFDEDNKKSVRKEMIARIRKLMKQKPRYILVETGDDQ